MSLERDAVSPVVVAEELAPPARATPAVSELSVQIDEPSGELSGRAILLAWVVSLFGHVFLFLVLFAVPWLTGMVRLPEDLPIPRTDLTPVQPHVEVVPEPEFATAGDSAMEELVTMEPQRFELMSNHPTGEHTDLAILVGTGGGDLSRVGLGGGIQTGPTFFGLGAEAREARRVVYVVDRSGSMIEHFDFVKEELKRSIKLLRRSQWFHVVFYDDGEPLEKPPSELVSASTPNKEAVFTFIDKEVGVGGGTDPIPALRRAFAVEPDMIYFLSDGDIPNRDELLSVLDRELNPHRSVRIFTVAFVDRMGAELLERVAREHRGGFRYVAESDIFD